jgi:thiamine-phosphate pyrophosphorylase
MLKGLYVITDNTLMPGRGHIEIAKAVLEAGARILQLRDKQATTRELVHTGIRLRELTRAYNALLIVNDRVDIAQAVQADGVHLGQEDMPLPLARQLMGEQAIIGISAETTEEAVRAESEGANYLGVGPMFSTSTKPDAGSPVGPERLKEIKRHVHLPVFGIGGITHQNYRLVLEAGADGICVIGAIVTAPDMQEAVRGFVMDG